MPTRLALVEDHAPTRRRMVEHLAYFDEVRVVLAAASGDLFLHAFDTLRDEERPQVVLMDIQLPTLSGIETTRQLKEKYPDVEVLMFTVFEDDERLFDSINAGASGYLLKDTPADAVVEAVQELRAGGAPVSPGLARKLLHLVRDGRPTDGEPAFELTDREQDVLRLVVEGSTNREIAEALFLSPLTVKTHIKNIYKKLHVRSRASVVQVALRHDLLR